MKIEKLKIKNFILLTLTLIFFIFSATKSFAMTGTIDMSVENKVKICKDVTCTNPAPGIIDFNINDGFPVIIDTEKGISGRAWGGEFGWVTFDGGVSFADSVIGLLKGTALSTTSGIINFFVTGQKVIIDPVTGEWNGWAWASGPQGGWIKFDCKQESCAKIKWKKEEVISPPVVPDTNAVENIPISPPVVVVPVPDVPAPTTNTGEKISLVSYSTFFKPGELFGNVLDNFSISFVNLYNKTIKAVVYLYNSLFSFLTNLRGLFLGK